MRINVTGFSHMKGNSKSTGKPYEMARLYRLTEIKAWENELGRSRCAGFETNERKVLEVDIQDSKLADFLLGISYPVDLEISLEPNPEDPMRNLIVGAKVAS